MGERCFDKGLFDEEFHFSLLIHPSQGYHGSRFTCPSRSACAVEVILGIGRCIGVHDQTHVVDMDSSRSNVGGNKNRRLTGLKCL
jgi:hypothetical protein